MSRLNQKGITHIALIMLLVVGLIAAVYLVQTQTNLLPKAAEPKSGNTKSADITSLGGTELGIQIDATNASKIPNSSQLSTLKPQWIRLVYHPNIGIPQSLPSNVKILLIFNNESAPGAPIANIDDRYYEPLNFGNLDRTEIVGYDSVDAWKKYVDDSYIPALTKLLYSNPNVPAIEVWNEPDGCSDKVGYCPKVPAESYAYLIKRAARIIKTIRPNIQVVMGGLYTGDVNYIRQIKQFDPSALNDVDAVGLHPYGKSPDGWCAG